MKELPKFLKSYFWDVDFKEIDPKENRVYILKRILNYGDERAIQWLNRYFSKDEQKEVLCKGRNFSLRSANFWALILGVHKNRVKCLQRYYLRRRKQLWPY